MAAIGVDIAKPYADVISEPANIQRQNSFTGKMGSKAATENIKTAPIGKLKWATRQECTIWAVERRA